MYRNLNVNPLNNYTGDCVIRALAVALDKSWDEIFLELMVTAYEMKDMPSSNNVWAKYLHDKGFRRETIPDICPKCVTIRDFANSTPRGIYILGTGTHVVAVIDGDYYDTWDSGNEIPVFYWKRG